MKLLLCFCLLIAIKALINSAKIPTSVIDLNEKFLDVKNKGFWFVMVCNNCWIYSIS